jgi:hypothetical protein
LLLPRGDGVTGESCWRGSRSLERGEDRPAAERPVSAASRDAKSLISAEFPLPEFPTAMEAARGGDNLKTLLVP